MALPEVEAVNEGFAQQNAVITDNRERLQQSMRAGQLNIAKSIDLGFMKLISFEKMKLEQQKIQEGFMLEALREAGRKPEPEAKVVEEEKKEEKGTNWWIILGLVGTFLTGFVKGLLDALRAWGKTVKGSIKLLLVPFTKLLGPIINPIKGMFGKEGAIGKHFANLGVKATQWADDAGKGLAKLGNLVKGPFTAEGSVGKLFTSMKTTITGFANNGVTKIKALGEGIKGLFAAGTPDKPGGPVARMFAGVTNAFKGGWTAASTKLATWSAGIKGIFGEGGQIMKMVNGVKGVFTFPFAPFMATQSAAVQGIFAAGTPDKPGGPVSRMVSAVVKPFKAAAAMATKAMAPIKAIFGEGGRISKLLASFKSAFKIFQAGSGLAKTLGTVGRVLGRIFWPFTVILAIWDGIKGAIEGYEKGGFVGAILGGIGGVLSSIVGMPLDLLKDVVSWVAEKMGFKGVSKFLDSFSISTIIKSIITNPLNILKMAANAVIGAIASVIRSVGEKLPGWLGGKAIVRAADWVEKQKFKTEKFEIKEAKTPTVKIDDAEAKKMAGEYAKREGESAADYKERMSKLAAKAGGAGDFEKKAAAHRAATAAQNAKLAKLEADQAAKEKTDKLGAGSAGLRGQTVIVNDNKKIDASDKSVKAVNNKSINSPSAKKPNNFGAWGTAAQWGATPGYGK